MANTDFQQVLSATGNVSRSAVIAALEGRGVYVVQDDEDPQDLTPGSVTHIAFNGVLFWYDDADATTPHDGTACLVTADGKRFKADALSGAQRRHWYVLDKDLTSPPGSPSEGDAYIVASGASGDWAGEDKHVAVYTARGWLFIVPAAYDIATVDDESLIYHYSSGGSWTSGIGALTIGANTVYPSAIKYFRHGLAVTNQTTNAPPGSPSDGDAYIIGGSPSGAWSGKARQVAIYESSAWGYYAPYEGATAYDRDTSATVVYDGSSWVPQISGYSQISATLTAAQLTGTTTCGNYTYSATTAPTTATANESDTASATFTAKKSGATLEIEYEADFFLYNNDGGSSLSLDCVVIGLQVDSNATMSDWAVVPCDVDGLSSLTADVRIHKAKVTLITTAADTSSHTYTARWFADIKAASNGDPRFRFSRRRLIVRELA